MRSYLDQMGRLENSLWRHAGFIIDYKQNDATCTSGLADHHARPCQWNYNSPISILLIGIVTMRPKANGSTFLLPTCYRSEVKNKFYQDLFQLIPELPKERRSHFSKPALAISTVLLGPVGLYRKTMRTHHLARRRTGFWCIGWRCRNQSLHACSRSAKSRDPKTGNFLKIT